MLQYDDLKMKIKDIKALFDSCKKSFDLSAMSARMSELSVLQQEPDLYKDIKRATAINSEFKYLSDITDDLTLKERALADLTELLDMAQEDGDEDLLPEIEQGCSDLEKKIESLQLTTLLSGEYDKVNAILSLHAGAGGTEAQDWVQMLYRMYTMFAAKNGYKLEELDYLDGDEAGIKSVTFRLCGINAYGYLKAEKGVHRLVRISPFDSNARRHTSFASLEVMPEIEADENIKINSDDLRVDTYRSGGAGGQHVNKTESAIRITHIPSGIVVQCQNERSQIQNRETAMKMLLSKLTEKRLRDNEEKAAGIKGEIKKIEWGSQIRSYVFQPYTMVKDHRTGYETSDVFGMMDGNYLQEFILDYLRKSR